MFRSINLSINKYFLIISLISILYSIFLGSGFYGFGSDYFTTYSKFSNYSPKIWFKDMLGYKIATLNINNIYLGTYLISFFTCFSAGTLIYQFHQINKNTSYIYFLILFLIIIHTWPVLKSSNTALRQGLAMSYIFLSLSALNKRKIKTSLLLILVVLFSHTSGPFFFIIYIITIFFKILANNSLLKKYKITIFFINLLIAVLFYFYILYTKDVSTYGKVFGYNFAPIFFIINMMLIFCFTINLNKFFNNFLFLFSYSFLIISIPIFLHDLVTQYERLNMMVLILNIFILGFIFKKKYINSIWFLIFSSLLIITFLTGMYIPFVE